MKRVVFLLGLLFFIGNVLAIEGVNPAIYKIDFEEGLSRNFVFEFVMDGREDLKMEGDLAKYFSLDKDRVFGKEKVTVSVDFYEDIDLVGTSDVLVVAGDVRGIIRINFAYPEKFFSSDILVKDVNAGEDVGLEVVVSNFGREGDFFSGEVDVRLGELVVDSFILEESFLEEGESISFFHSLDGREVFFGNYLVSSVIKSGEDVFVDTNEFRAGEDLIRIVNYTSEIGDGIEKFEVEVQSLSNKGFENVFAEVRVIGRRADGGEVFVDRVGGFDTSIVSLSPWEKKKLVGYFDASDFEGELMVSIDVHFDDKVESEVVRVNVLKPQGLLISFIIFSSCFFGFLFWRLFLKK